MEEIRFQVRVLMKDYKFFKEDFIPLLERELEEVEEQLSCLKNFSFTGVPSGRGKTSYKLENLIDKKIKFQRLLKNKNELVDSIESVLDSLSEFEKEVLKAEIEKIPTKVLIEKSGLSRTEFYRQKDLMYKKIYYALIN